MTQNRVAEDGFEGDRMVGNFTPATLTGLSVANDAWASGFCTGILVTVVCGIYAACFAGWL